MPLLVWLTRWEGKWITVYSADSTRADDGELVGVKAKLLNVGQDFIHVRQWDGYEVVFAARAIFSVGLVKDQDETELNAMQCLSERKESHVDR